MFYHLKDLLEGLESFESLPLVSLVLVAVMVMMSVNYISVTDGHIILLTWRMSRVVSDVSHSVSIDWWWGTVWSGRISYHNRSATDCLSRYVP